MHFLKSIKISGYGWKGKYKTWAEATKHCTGYNDEIINFLNGRKYI